MKRRLLSIAVATMIASGSVVAMTSESEAAVSPVATGYILYSVTGEIQCVYRDQERAQAMLDQKVAEDNRWYPELIPIDIDVDNVLPTDDPDFVPVLHITTPIG